MAVEVVLAAVELVEEVEVWLERGLMLMLCSRWGRQCLAWLGRTIPFWLRCNDLNDNLKSKCDRKMTKGDLKPKFQVPDNLEFSCNEGENRVQGGYYADVTEEARCQVASEIMMTSRTMAMMAMMVTMTSTIRIFDT